jgi:hypothetical protein
MACLPMNLWLFGACADMNYLTNLLAGDLRYSAPWFYLRAISSIGRIQPEVELCSTQKEPLLLFNFARIGTLVPPRPSQGWLIL